MVQTHVSLHASFFLGRRSASAVAGAGPCGLGMEEEEEEAEEEEEEEEEEEGRGERRCLPSAADHNPEVRPGRCTASLRSGRRLAHAHTSPSLVSSTPSDQFN